MPDVDGMCVHIYESSKLEGSCVGDSLYRAEDQHGTYGGTEGLASCMNFKSAAQSKRRRLVLVSQAEELGLHTPGKLSYSGNPRLHPVPGQAFLGPQRILQNSESECL